MKFDFLTDLHLDLWQENIKDWRGLGTNLVCVVGGDVSRDVRLTTSFLKHLCDAYRHVIFIDGNHEHNSQYHDLSIAETALNENLATTKNITYLANNSCVIDGTAFIGSNGWWTFDFPEINGGTSRLDCMSAFCEAEDIPLSTAVNIWTTAQEQVDFLCDVVSELQYEDDIEEIVVVTHTVPRADIVIPTTGTSLHWSKLGNSAMQDVLKYDRNGKISTWCFGHYHLAQYDLVLDGVRYISHPRGTPRSALSPSYYPKMISTANESIRNDIF